MLALSLELDALDTVEIDVAVGTGEQRPGAAGRDDDVLAYICAAEVERVEAAAALDHVIAVAGIPNERVVAGAEERRVGAFTANDRVVAGAADEGIVAGAADEGVLAVAAEQVCGGQRLPCGRRYVVERDRVVAVPAEHIDFGGVDERRLAAIDGYGAVVHQNLTSRVAAGRDGVAEVVSGLRQYAGSGVKARLDSHGLSPFKGLTAARMRVGREQGPMGALAREPDA